MRVREAGPRDRIRPSVICSTTSTRLCNLKQEHSMLSGSCCERNLENRISVQGPSKLAG